MLILYGSQKGNAKSIAETICEQSVKFGFPDSEIKAGNDFAKKLDEFAKEVRRSFVVFVLGIGPLREHSLIHSSKHTHTHTHTYIYTYLKL